MTDICKTFVLPENFRVVEDGSLLDFLRGNATGAVRVDAGRLRRMDTALIELLLCGAQAWRKADLSFEVANLSLANAEVVTTLGLTSDHVNWRMAE